MNIYRPPSEALIEAWWTAFTATTSTALSRGFNSWKMPLRHSDSVLSELTERSCSSGLSVLGIKGQKEFSFTVAATHQDQTNTLQIFRLRAKNSFKHFQNRGGTSGLSRKLRSLSRAATDRLKSLTGGWSLINRMQLKSAVWGIGKYNRSRPNILAFFGEECMEMCSQGPGERE